MRPAARLLARLLPVALFLLLLGDGPQGARFARAAEVLITVTSAADDPGNEAFECPDAAQCTLRAAIELANADASAESIRIVFDPAVFAGDNPVSIFVSDGPLPPITRTAVTIDASNVSVVLDGSNLQDPSAIGLYLAGVDNRVFGLSIRAFSAACLALGGSLAIAGDTAPAFRNRVDDCPTGIEVNGAGASIAGNLVGLAPADPQSPVMSTGIAVSAADVVVGTTFNPAPANVIGRVQTGVLIGRGPETPFTGVVVQRNRIGSDLGAAPAPVGVAVLVSHPSNATQVVQNEIGNAGTGVGVAADSGGRSTTGNTVRGNTFAGIAGLAIDLGMNGLLEPNDPGDFDSGPNTLLNSPMVTTATQGQVAGTACPGCLVSFYTTDHVPGPTLDSPTVPIPALDVTSDQFGNFALISPPVTPGDWIMAVATDPLGNTSEFAPSIRIGAGFVQCGSHQLLPGWNLVGYFGESTLLGGQVPPAGVLAVHHLIDGPGGGYLSWFSNGSVGLSVIQTGEAYWFYAEETTFLPGAVSLSSGLPVQLVAGWNDFVYVGASENVDDALASLGARWDALYEFDAAARAWHSYGGPDVPAYVHAFDTLEACGAYRIHMTGDALLIPLQP
jgi:CSLREA domain-containing protein